MYRGGSAREQHFDVPCQLYDVILRASDDSVSDDMSIEGGEMDGKGSEDGPCKVGLNIVPIMLGEDPF